MIEVWLIRHGEPDWEPNGSAVNEPELTALGREQARRTGERLQAEAFDSFYVSPLRRARETADEIAHALGREPTQRRWLAELGLPSLAGQTPEQVRSFFDAAQLRDLEKWWDGLGDGESFRHFYERVRSGADDLFACDHGMQIHEDSGHRIWRAPGQPRRVLVVAHEGTNAVLISHLLGIEPVPWVFVRFASQHCGIARLRTTAAASGVVWQMLGFNAVEHLEGLEQTR